MSMQIHVDPAGLSQEQREAVAGFILAFPGKACAGTCGHAVAFTGDPSPGTAVAEIHAHTEDGGAPLDAEIAQLVKEDGEFQASVAFGAPTPDAMAAAAFGSAPTPLPPGAMAPSTLPGAAAATVAPPPQVNTAPIMTTPGVASSVELDKHGLPWDSRIHVESKNKNADGSWRNKRNLDPALKAQVEAELRQLMAAPGNVQPAASTAPSVPTPPPATVAPVTANLPTASVSPAVVPPPPVAPGEVPQDARQQFVALVGRASAAIQGGKVTQAEVNQCCADSGVPALPLLANRLDLVATVAAKVDALIAARG